MLCALLLAHYDPRKEYHYSALREMGFRKDSISRSSRRLERGGLVERRVKRNGGRFSSGGRITLRGQAVTSASVASASTTSGTAGASATSAWRSPGHVLAQVRVLQYLNERSQREWELARQRVYAIFPDLNDARER